jgi:RyR domain-containing protein
VTAIMDEATVERLAQAIHQEYLRERAKRGVAMGATPAMAAWDDLSDDLREANRAQARDVDAKLAAISCAVVRSSLPVTEAFRFTEQELELLTRQEQQRWAAQRRAAGWKHATVRDDYRKHHPDLVAWEQLPESERDKDRDAVRCIPAILATVGLTIVRRTQRT